VVRPGVVVEEVVVVAVAVVAAAVFARFFKRVSNIHVFLQSDGWRRPQRTSLTRASTLEPKDENEQKTRE